MGVDVKRGGLWLLLPGFASLWFAAVLAAGQGLKFWVLAAGLVASTPGVAVVVFRNVWIAALVAPAVALLGLESVLIASGFSEGGSPGAGEVLCFLIQPSAHHAIVAVVTLPPVFLHRLRMNLDRSYRVPILLGHLFPGFVWMLGEFIVREPFQGDFGIILIALAAGQWLVMEAALEVVGDVDASPR